MYVFPPPKKKDKLFPLTELIDWFLQFRSKVTKNFCVLHNTVEHNYILSSSTVGIRSKVSAEAV